MKNIKILGFVGFLAFMISCSGGKKLTKTEQNKSETEMATASDTIPEQKEMEFEYLFVEALKQKMFGNAQNAIQILSSCLEIDPNSSAAMYELAGIHAANNDFTSSALLLEKAISIDPDNPWYKQLLAQIYQQSRKFVKAAEIYDQLLEDDPDNMDFLYTKAVLLSNAGEFGRAISAYQEMEKETGINEQISVAKQQLYVLNDQVDKAFGEIERLIKENPTEAKYYGLLADLYQSQGDSVNALKNYNKILELDPQSGFVHFSLANYYLAQNKLEKSYSETVEGLSSKNVDLQTKLQLFLMLASDREKSKLTEKQEEELILLLIGQHPDEYMVYTIYADNLLRKNMLAEGRAQLLKALELESNDYMIWERVMFIDNDLQEWDSLMQHSATAAEFFPNQPNVYFLNAVAAVQLEKYEEAISVSEEGLDYVVDNPELEGQFLMLVGEAEYKLGNVDKAFELFDESVELNPDNYIAMNNYAYYLSIAGRDLDKAERMSGRVVERFPDNSTYLDTHAWVLFKKSEYKLAKFYMESAIKNGGEENGTLLEHYGDILFKLGQEEEAVKNWEKAKKLGGASKLLERKINKKKYIEE